VGFGEVMQPINAVGGMVEHHEDRARTVFRPRKQGELPTIPGTRSLPSTFCWPEDNVALAWEGWVTYQSWEYLF
jgi:hypothetical protein